MAKQHEIEYALRMNAEHAVHKPFSDDLCGWYLIRIGTLMTLFPPRPARILDLGCGTGWTSLFFAKAGYDVVGVDIAPEMIRLANEQRDLAKLRNLSFKISDYESLSFRSEFDAVVFFDSLHHAENEKIALARAFEALKPGGILVAEEPGVGHAEAEHSLHAVAEFGVTEKDMPPPHIVALGREVGFTGFRVFPSPGMVNQKLYHESFPASADPFAAIHPAAEAQRGLLSRLWWRSALAFSRSQGQWRALMYSLQQYRGQGLVLLQKGAANELRAAA